MEQSNSGNPVLHGWKEISGYSRRSVRTLQRWTREFNFPVHNIAHTRRSPVCAYPHEIDAWLEHRPNNAIESREQLLHRIEQLESQLKELRESQQAGSVAAA
jgi:hypothetical protein